MAQVLSVNFSLNFHAKQLTLLDNDLLTVGELSWDLRHQLQSIGSVELSRVVNLAGLELSSDVVIALTVLLFILARERQ